MVDSQKLRQIIAQAALDLGIQAYGITSAAPLNEQNHLDSWLGQGYSASMNWLQRNPSARCEPKSLLPEAQSVICLAFRYGEHGIINKQTFNSIPINRARFARGAEYHQHVRNNLETLSNLIKQYIPQAKFKFCVDTSPIMEKALAARAGLGWIGKNTLLIHPKHGSYLVLGELITNIPLSHSERSEAISKAPFKGIVNVCGDCTKCLEACPTKALVEPYKLDTRRCLSYLTIEHKGEIPPELAGFIKPGQYGCDICQEVCPYNKTAVNER